MGEPASNHLVQQLRWCVEHPADDVAWPAFYQQVSSQKFGVDWAGLGPKSFILNMAYHQL